MKERDLVYEALACENLRHSLVNVIGIDDGDGTLAGRKKPHEYTDTEIIAEAKYVLSCYYEGGHNYNDELNGYHSLSDKKRAVIEVRELKTFIKRHLTSK